MRLSVRAIERGPAGNVAIALRSDRSGEWHAGRVALYSQPAEMAR